MRQGVNHIELVAYLISFVKQFADARSSSGAAVDFKAMSGVVVLDSDIPLNPHLPGNDLTISFTGH